MEELVIFLIVIATLYLTVYYSFSLSRRRRSNPRSRSNTRPRSSRNASRNWGKLDDLIRQVGSSGRQDWSLPTNLIVEGQVTRVIDGDTIEVTVTGEYSARKVRLIGVDTPETVHPNKSVEYFGPEASTFTKKQLIGEHVWLVYDVAPLDRYNRDLAYVWTRKPGTSESAIRDGMFNARLLLNGHGKVETVAPNSHYARLFEKFEREARRANLGRWANKYY